MILVYDITSRKSFAQVAAWLARVREELPAGVPTVLIGNKLDLESSRQVAFREGEALAKQKEIFFFETSAKSGRFIEEAMREIVRLTAQQVR